MGYGINCKICHFLRKPGDRNTFILVSQYELENHIHHSPHERHTITMRPDITKSLE